MGKTLRERLADPTRHPVRTWSDLLRFCRIPPDGWEAIVIGDGSATTWDKAGGWGSVLVEREQLARQPFYGSLSHATNNVAELLALLHPLLYLANHDAVNTIREGGYRVHLLSDSEYVVNNLRRVHDAAWASGLTKNRELWLAFHGLWRRGFVLTTHHLPRDQIDLQKLCHDLANLSRRQLGTVLPALGWDVAETNPED